jgi:hypothetical protein
MMTFISRNCDKREFDISEKIVMVSAPAGAAYE